MSDCKQSKFVKEQEASGSLNSFGMKAPSSKTPLRYSLSF